MPAKIEVADVSILANLTPAEKISARKVAWRARRGLDVSSVTLLWWHVCVLCDLPTKLRADISACCGETTRLQGWTTGERSPKT